MIPLEECRKILNTGAKIYATEQIKRIREILYQLATIQLEIESGSPVQLMPLWEEM